MAEKNLYRVRLYRKNGEISELLMQANDDELALYNAEKSFKRKFELVGEEDGYPVLEEIRK